MEELTSFLISFLSTLKKLLRLLFLITSGLVVSLILDSGPGFVVDLQVMEELLHQWD